MGKIIYTTSEIDNREKPFLLDVRINGDGGFKYSHSECVGKFRSGENKGENAYMHIYSKTRSVFGRFFDYLTRKTYQ